MYLQSEIKPENRKEPDQKQAASDEQATNNHADAIRQRKLIADVSGSDLLSAFTTIQQKVDQSITQGGNALAIQMIRAQLNAPPVPISLAGLEAAAAAIDVEIAQLDAAAPEVVQGFVEMGNVNRWRDDYDVNIAALRGLNPGANTYTVDEIRARADAMTTAVHAVVINLGNIRRALNESLTGYNQLVQQKEMESQASEAFAKFESDKAQPKKPVKKIISPYTGKAGTYDGALGGAIVLVSGNHVVVMEHYQLKHNPDIAVLYTGGAWKGKKGTTLDGGWEAHVSTYAPEVLVEAKKLIAAYGGEVKDGTKLPSGNKSRLSSIDAYISVVRSGNDWLIFYHGNPPE